MSRRCAKNQAPPKPVIEFRVFDTRFGAAMTLAISFARRLVARICEASTGSAVPAGDGESAQPLFEWLDLDYDEYVETLRSDFLSHADFLDFLNALG